MWLESCSGTWRMILDECTGGRHDTTLGIGRVTVGERVKIDVKYRTIRGRKRESNTNTLVLFTYNLSYLMKNHENSRKIMKNHEKSWKNMKNHDRTITFEFSIYHNVVGYINIGRIGLSVSIFQNSYLLKLENRDWNSDHQPILVPLKLLRPKFGKFGKFGIESAIYHKKGIFLI